MSYAASLFPRCASESAGGGFELKDHLHLDLCGEREGEDASTDERVGFLELPETSNPSLCKLGAVLAFLGMELPRLSDEHDAACLAAGHAFARRHMAGVFPYAWESVRTAVRTLLRPIMARIVVG